MSVSNGISNTENLITWSKLLGLQMKNLRSNKILCFILSVAIVEKLRLKSFLLQRLSLRCPKFFYKLEAENTELGQGRVPFPYTNVFNSKYVWTWVLDSYYLGILFWVPSDLRGYLWSQYMSMFVTSSNENTPTPVVTLWNESESLLPASPPYGGFPVVAEIPTWRSKLSGSLLWADGGNRRL